MPATSATKIATDNAEERYAENASSWERWVEYVDTDGTTTRQEFDAMSFDQKMDLQRQAFGG